MAAKKNPFAKAATDKKGSGGSGLDKITDPPDEVKFSVDEYKRIDGEIKRLEGEQGAHKSIVEVFARATFAERQAVTKKSGNFSIVGEKSHVTFIAQNASSGMTAAEYEAFAQKYGEKAAEELLHLNKGTVKFNKETLEEPGVMEKVVEALSSLPDDLVDRLFTPAYYTVTDDVAIKAREYAKDAKKYAQLVADLKLKAYIRG